MDLNDLRKNRYAVKFLDYIKMNNNNKYLKSQD